MAAVAASSGSEPPRLKTQLPVALWNDSSTDTNDDVIEHALRDDPDLADIASRLDSRVSLDPDRDLGLDADSYCSDAASDGQARDDSADTASTTSSQKDSGLAADGGGASDASASPDGERKFQTNQSKSEASSSAGGEGSVRPAEHSTSAKAKASSSSSSRHSNGSSKNSKISVNRRGSVESSMSRGSAKETTSATEKPSSSSSKKNPLQLLRRLTKFDKPRKKSVDYQSEFAAVVVDRLPQVFVVKYLGHRQVSGVCGLHHVRRPVDEMVKAVKQKLDDGSEVELPLLYVVVSPKGLDLREHKQNHVPDVAPLGVMPIDFISYGVQDIKFWRVFTCIVVRELSSRSRSATCHAFLCDSSHNGRKMALALGAAFNVYSKRLTSAGKTHNFQIELRPPDELADAVDAEFEA